MKRRNDSASQDKKPRVQPTARQRTSGRRTPPTAASRSAADRSTAEHLLAILKTGGDTRAAKVRRVRQGVRRQTYENDLKLSIAADRLARELSA